YMKKQAQEIAHCAGDKEAVSLEAFYSYTSDYNRHEKLPPSYIIDATGFVGHKAKAGRRCDSGQAVCKGGLCAVMGYGVHPDGGGQNFAYQVVKWFPETAPKPNERAPKRMWLDLVVPENERVCAAARGKFTDAGCIRRFEWHATGLTPVAFADVPPVEAGE
ncbi:MAG: hypothetical protein PHE27_08375, partial [Alphaproteobacteria bacterium]|nr:hypothetical protein [Alphaproteobacteria bacterium]